jgi:hypothetical protein
MGGGGVNSGGGGAVFPKNTAQIKHIFAERAGHLPDTVANRALIFNTANDPACFLGKDKHSVSWYAKTLVNGSQVWVQVFNGVISDAGLNSPHLWDPETGLSRNIPRTGRRKKK